MIGLEDYANSQIGWCTKYSSINSRVAVTVKVREAKPSGTGKMPELGLALGSSAFAVNSTVAMELRGSLDTVEDYGESAVSERLAILKVGGLSCTVCASSLPTELLHRRSASGFWSSPMKHSPA